MKLTHVPVHVGQPSLLTLWLSSSYKKSFALGLACHSIPSVQMPPAAVLCDPLHTGVQL